MSSGASVKGVDFAVSIPGVLLEMVRVVGGGRLIGRAPAEEAAEPCREQAKNKMLFHLALRVARPTTARNCGGSVWGEFTRLAYWR